MLQDIKSKLTFVIGDEDIGPRIPQEQHQHLFQELTDLRHEAQGNRLGLHLCRMLVELMQCEPIGLRKSLNLGVL